MQLHLPVAAFPLEQGCSGMRKETCLPRESRQGSPDDVDPASASAQATATSAWPQRQATGEIAFFFITQGNETVADSLPVEQAAQD